jgi:glutamine synthetase
VQKHKAKEKHKKNKKHKKEKKHGHDKELLKAAKKFLKESKSTAIACQPTMHDYRRYVGSTLFGKSRNVVL